MAEEKPHCDRHFWRAMGAIVKPDEIPSNPLMRMAGHLYETLEFLDPSVAAPSWRELPARDRDLYRLTLLKLLEQRRDLIALLNAPDNDMIAWSLDGREQTTD